MTSVLRKVLMQKMLLLSQEVQEGEKEKKDEEKEKEKKKEAEPNFQLLENPARVMPAQLKVLIMPDTCRYQPFKPVTTHVCLSVCVSQCVWISLSPVKMMSILRVLQIKKKKTIHRFESTS